MPERAKESHSLITLGIFLASPFFLISSQPKHHLLPPCSSNDIVPRGRLTFEFEFVTTPTCKFSSRLGSSSISSSFWFYFSSMSHQICCTKPTLCHHPMRIMMVRVSWGVQVEKSVPGTDNERSNATQNPFPEPKSRYSPSASLTSYPLPPPTPFFNTNPKMSESLHKANSPPSQSSLQSSNLY